jgi:hypothetical protein
LRRSAWLLFPPIAIAAPALGGMTAARNLRARLATSTLSPDFPILNRQISEIAGLEYHKHQRRMNLNVCCLKELWYFHNILKKICNYLCFLKPIFNFRPYQFVPKKQRIINFSQVMKESLCLRKVYWQ